MRNGRGGEGEEGAKAGGGARRTKKRKQRKKGEWGQRKEKKTAMLSEREREREREREANDSRGYHRRRAKKGRERGWGGGRTGWVTGGGARERVWRKTEKRRRQIREFCAECV